MQTIQEMTETWVAAGTKKGLKFPTRSTESEEIFLSKIKLICEASGVSIKEKRIDRKNGSSREITESSNTDLKREVASLARSYGMSKAEAILLLEGSRRVEIHGLSDKQLTESWKPYADILTESEVSALVKGRVAPPVKK
jgi:hypothetical protein